MNYDLAYKFRRELAMKKIILVLVFVLLFSSSYKWLKNNDEKDRKSSKNFRNDVFLGGWSYEKYAFTGNT